MTGLTPVLDKKYDYSDCITIRNVVPHVDLRIEYLGRHHAISLPAPSKDDAIRELKSMAMSANNGFLGDTIDWLFNDLWVNKINASSR